VLVAVAPTRLQNLDRAGNRERDGLVEARVDFLCQASGGSERILLTPPPDDPSRRFDDPRITGLDQRLGAQRIREIHALVWKPVARIQRVPILTAYEEGVSTQGLAPAVQVEAREIHAGEDESQLVPFLEIVEDDIASDSRRENQIGIDR